MAFNQNFHRKSQHRGRLMKKIKKKKKEERSQYAEDPSGWTRPKGLPCNTRLQQMDGHFRRVGLDRVSAWGVTSQDPEKFRPVLQNQVRLMEKRKKKIKVMDFIEKRMKSYDVYPQGLSKYTGFLLFDSYRLRNVHSIKDFTIEEILQQEVFTFEDMKLVAYVCLMGNWKYEKDFALLPLDMRKQCAKILPSAILSKYGPPSKMGGIYSICHPDRGGVDPNSIFEERKSLVIFPNDFQLMNRELRYIPCLFTRPLGSIIFEENCRFKNRASYSAGVLRYESHGNITRVTEYNVSTLLEYLYKERIEMKRERKYTVSVTKDDWQGFLHHAAVCYIYVKDHSTATGFLLSDRYILTNAHVIKDISNKGILEREVSVMFTFEDMKGGTYFLRVNVKPEIPAHRFEGNWRRGLDFALLELDLQEHEIQILPPAILSTYGPPSKTGGIYIIGHPGGGGKTSELCYITEDPMYLEDRIFRYKTNFTEGSSGSLIFGDHFQLLGMHTGGDKLSDGSATGFGIPMKIILDNLLLQLTEKINMNLCQNLSMKQRSVKHSAMTTMVSAINIAMICYEFQKLYISPCGIGQTSQETRSHGG
nr:uncharacterized protein LOC111853834 [Paramormyrops kingsleyae]